MTVAKFNVKEMAQKRREGASVRSLACHYGVCEQTIRFHLAKEGALPTKKNHEPSTTAMRAAVVAAQVYLDIGDYPKARTMLIHLEGMLEDF